MFEDTLELGTPKLEPALAAAQPSLLLIDAMRSLAQQAYFTFTSALGLAARDVEWLEETNAKMRETGEGPAIKTLVGTAKGLGLSIDGHLIQASATYR